MQALSRYRDPVQGILRIVTGLLFMQHGAQKLFGWPGGGETVQLLSQMGLAGVLELVGGALFVLGLLTRPVAFVLSGQMAVAYFQAHAPQGFWPVLNRGELAALYSFVFLYFVTAGPGAFSLDRRLGREPAPERERPAA